MKAEKKKAILLEVTAIGVITLFLTLVLAGTVAASPGTTYYVDDGTGDDTRNAVAAQNPATPWKTITHAVATVPAGASLADPNIINVSAGLYDNTTNGETFPITFNNDSISLIGAGAATTIIDGGGATEILDINASNITIEGFTITNGTNGIFSDDFVGFTILDNTFTNLSDGVHFGIDKGFGDSANDNYTIDDICIRGNTFNISDNGFYFSVRLDYDATVTGYTVTIGDFDILDNVFNMVTTDGVDIEDIWVTDLTGGSISMGDVNISGNKFYGGEKGIDFYGGFFTLTNTTVTAGDVVVNDNTFENQTSYAMYIDYYGATEWYGTTTGTCGDLVINGNTITSVTTDAIYIDAYAYFETFEDEASLTVGNLYVEGNEINVSGYGLYVYYLAEYLYNNASIALGDVFINNNTIVSREGYGIELEYNDFGDDMDGNSEVTTDEVHIEENAINAYFDAIYVYYNHVAYEMEENANLSMGDIYVRDNNNISGDDDGVYLYYYDSGVGYDMHGNASAELPSYVITGNTFNVSLNGIYLYNYGNPHGAYDDTLIDFGGFFIDDNTFECGGDGIYLFYEVVCHENYDSSATIIGDITVTGNTFDVDGDGIYLYVYETPYSMDNNATFYFGELFIDDNTFSCEYGIYLEYYETPYEIDLGDSYYSNVIITFDDVIITNNRFYDVDYYAIRIYYDEIGYDLIYNSTLEFGDLLIADNVIDNLTDGDGIDVADNVYSYDESRLTMGMLDILRNEISNVSEDGVKIYYYFDASGNSTQTIGRALIQGNTIDACGWAGVYLYMDLYNASGATVNLGDPLIEENTISDCGDGVDFEDVENATIRRNMIVNNTGSADSGVDLNSGSADNEIYENCFIGNTPYQAVDNGTNNIFTSNFWNDWDGSGAYEIYGTANNSDANPLDECRRGEGPSAPAQLPALTPVGLITLVGVLSAIVVLNIVRRRTREE